LSALNHPNSPFFHNFLKKLSTDLTKKIGQKVKIVQQMVGDTEKSIGIMMIFYNAIEEK